MHSSLIGKVEKANRYARELDRITVDRLALTFRGDNDTHHVSLDAGELALHLPLLRELGFVRPPARPPEDLRGHAARGGAGLDLQRARARHGLTVTARATRAHGSQATTARSAPTGSATRRP